MYRLQSPWGMHMKGGGGRVCKTDRWFCFVAGAANLMMDILSELAQSRRADAGKRQSGSILLLGPPGVGELLLATE